MKSHGPLWISLLLLLGAAGMDAKAQGYPVTFQWSSANGTYAGVWMIDVVAPYPRTYATGASMVANLTAGTHLLWFGQTGPVVFAVTDDDMGNASVSCDSKAYPSITCSGSTVQVNTMPITINAADPRSGGLHYDACFTPGWMYDGASTKGYGGKSFISWTSNVPLGLPLSIDDGAHLGGSDITFNIDSAGNISGLAPAGAATSAGNTLYFTPVQIAIAPGHYGGRLYLAGYATSVCTKTSVDNPIPVSAPSSSGIYAPTTFTLLPGLTYSIDNGTEVLSTALSFSLRGDGKLGRKSILPEESAWADNKPSSGPPALRLRTNKMNVTATNPASTYVVSSYRVPGTPAKGSATFYPIDGLFVWIQNSDANGSSYPNGQGYEVMPGCEQILYKGTKDELKLGFELHPPVEACESSFPQSF